MRTQAGIAGLLLIVAGCGGSPTAAAPTQSLFDAVTSITEMNPAPGTPLQAGRTVTFSGTAGYTLASADVGVMVMTIQDQNNRVLSNGSQTVVAKRGTGDATLTQTITLPDSGVTSVRVFFVLAPSGAASTTAVLNVSYPVQ